METGLACIRLAASQFGILSRAQALEAGLSHAGVQRRVRSGLWEQALPGVYRVGGSPRSWEQDLVAACMYVGGAAVASHRSAAALWKLRGFDQGLLEVSGHKRGVGDGILLHQVLVRPAHRTALAGIPVTTVVRTLMDLGAVVPEERVENALDDAVRRNMVTLDELRQLLKRDGGRGRRGVGVLRKVVQRRPEGAPEREPAGGPALPHHRRRGAPGPHPAIRGPGRRRVRGQDRPRIPENLLAIEAEGYAWHSGRLDWQRDLARRNALSTLGWTVLHFTADNIRGDPDRVLRTLAKNLRLA